MPTMRPWRTASAAASTLDVGKRKFEIHRLVRARQGRAGAGAAAVFAAHPAREPAAPRGRQVGQGSGHPRARAAGTRRPSPPSEIAFMPARVLLQDFTGVPAVVDLAAMRDGDEGAGRRSDAHQPAAAGRAGHRSLGAGRRVRQARGAVAERADRVRAQQGALRVPALGAGGVPQLRGRAARHRHRPPGEPGVPGARRVHGGVQRTARRAPTPTRWSAPTRTRRWSTAWACWAGASAASRPRRRCSGSRCRC